LEIRRICRQYGRCAARAQQTEQVRRISVLMNVAAEHPESQPEPA